VSSFWNNLHYNPIHTVEAGGHVWRFLTLVYASYSTRIRLFIRSLSLIWLLLMLELVTLGCLVLHASPTHTIDETYVGETKPW